MTKGPKSRFKEMSQVKLCPWSELDAKLMSEQGPTVRCDSLDKSQGLDLPVPSEKFWDCTGIPSSRSLFAIRASGPSYNLYLVVTNLYTMSLIFVKIDIMNDSVKLISVRCLLYGEYGYPTSIKLSCVRTASLFEPHIPLPSVPDDTSNKFRTTECTVKPWTIPGGGEDLSFSLRL